MKKQSQHKKIYIIIFKVINTNINIWKFLYKTYGIKFMELNFFINLVIIY